ncbi:EthD family reductase [Reyranella sp. CPCC 100927]|uniref:EthD family reductase n=1 Tax=Reyranella sp. CPCC 100927 TaxID=2599616 RepID=UPI0011B7636F|nr:EthD family reductase [Reyranella sp. CPCC 100927]TWT11573.1 EthD family reductase [Reyranella sp. CPCC 100927]
MAKVVVLYKTPKDKAAFDAYYKSTHIPLAYKIPGLKTYEVSQGGVGTPAGASDIHLVAILAFDSMADLQKGMGSPEGQAAGADVANFASGGADVLLFDSKDA